MDRLDALRLFVEVAEAGSLSGAARSATVAASTVTLALQKLESEVGARLIARTARLLVFTHEGQRFLADARRVLAECDAAMLSLRDDVQMQGPIHIAAVRSATIIDTHRTASGPITLSVCEKTVTPS